MSTEEKVTRKLRAILSADVKGYSLLMADDEAYTVRKLEEYRPRMSNLIKANSGRVVDSVGDNLLAEFSSAVDAVNCAVDIQKALKAKNSELAKDKQLNFRIGVNIGDVIQDKDRIYGAGVNVAARIEGLADPGGICISRNAYDHIKDKLELGYKYLGEHQVKNIKDPVRVYKVLMDPEKVGILIGEKPKPSGGKWIWLTVVLAAIILTSVIWQHFPKKSAIDVKSLSLANVTIAMPAKPSIAVIPFNNLGDDPKQEYFSDGITNDLITDLSRVSGLFVISRNSAFIYKDKSIPVHQIAKELGVKYVLEGSVRKNENKIRINAQLTDGTTGYNMWADRYDVEYADIFELQDQITRKIVAALAVQLTSSEQEQISSRDTDNLDAYDAYLKGREYAFRLTPDDFGKACKYFEKAIELDPKYFRAYAGLSGIYFNSYFFRWHKSLGVSYIEAARSARQYLDMAMVKPTSLAYSVASQMNLNQRLHEEALDAAEHALALDPNEILGYISMAQSLIFSGRPKEAVEQRNIIWLIMSSMPFNDLETVEFILEGLAKAGLPEQAHGYYKILKENRLSGNEIRALVFGKTITGFIQWPPPRQYWLHREGDGIATIRRGDSGDFKEGRSWVENDKLCNLWPESNQGRKICYPVFRNPDGSYEKKDEYFGKTDGSIVAFSPLD